MEEIKDLTKTSEENSKAKRDYLLPASVLIAALLISASLIYNVGKKPANPTAAGLNDNPPTTASLIDKVKPVSNSDHILGDPNAPVKIVEFSDLECPFCKEIHSVLHDVVASYGGQVAWIYRHFPLDQLHPKARHEAEASECANALGGNDKFWAYIDKVFGITPSNNGLDPALLPQIAEQIGLDKTQFQSCLDSGKYADVVSADEADANNSGARGTPYSIVIAKDGKKSVIPGALPEAQIKTIIDQAIKG